MLLITIKFVNYPAIHLVVSAISFPSSTTRNEMCPQSTATTVNLHSSTTKPSNDEGGGVTAAHLNRIPILAVH